MNILFFNREFYQYDEMIEKSLMSHGYNVFSYSLIPCRKYVIKSNNILEMIYKYIVNKKDFFDEINFLKQNEIIDEVERKNVSIDTVFVLAGQSLMPQTLKRLRQKYPKAKFVWYIWDDICYLSEYQNNHDYFDVIISYNPEEAKRYKIEYLPLFYLQDVRRDSIYDLVSIGVAHKNRLRTIKRFLKYNYFPNKYIFLKESWGQRFCNIFNKDRKYLSNYMYVKSLPTSKVAEMMSQAKVILDVPASKQTGLTMRTFETMGVHKKLITTNLNVKNYDFYNPNNICVIDADNPGSIDKNFLNSDYEELPEAVFKKYSFETWLESIIKYF